MRYRGVDSDASLLPSPPRPLWPGGTVGALESGVVKIVLHIDVLTLLAAAVTLVAFLCFMFSGLALRHCAHLFEEARIASVMRALLIAMTVAVGAPILRWVSLLFGLDDLLGFGGGAMRGFGLVVVPVMGATSVFQALMIGSWVAYRIEQAEEMEEEEREELERERSEAGSPPKGAGAVES